MKIGFVIYGSLDTLSGGYLYDRKLVEYLRNAGDEVEIISLPWRNYFAHLTDNFTFRLWNPTARRWKVQEHTHSGHLAPALQNYDILIQDELNHPSLIGANRGKHPYPIISLVHHLRCSELRPKWQNDFYRIIEKKYLRSVDGFIFNSQTTKGVVNGLMVNEKSFVIAYPPTDRFGEAISESEIMERSKAEELRILFLGNVMERKGLHTLLKAVTSDQLSVNSNQTIIKIDVVGSLNVEPNYVKQMQEFVMVNGLSSMVTFHSSLDNEPLKQKLKHAHVLIVPSSYEGFGIVYLEGMGFGLPAIGTTAGAASEVIEHEKTGFLIEPNDSQSLATYISKLVKDRSLLNQLSLNARKRYISQPKWEETAKSIRDFLLTFQ
ncbi:MAG: group 1 glycosyl transferase [Chloroflexi bacterium OLB14]|nr:MAG: group 1 glycosyl transferase [Chloroflexi bacterium OLB14]